PLFSILSAWALCRMEMPGMMRKGLVGLVFYSAVLNFGNAFVVWYWQDLWKVSAGFSTREDYLSHPHPSYAKIYYSAVSYINTHLPEDSTVLFLGEERGYYCKRPFIAASPYDENPIIPLADSADNLKDLSFKLNKMGVSHLLVNRAADRYYQMISRLSDHG